MRCRLIVLTGLLAFAGKAASAQEAPKFEVAGVYMMIPEFFGATCHGGGGSVSFNLNHWFGVVGDVAGCKGSGSSGSGLFGSSADNAWLTYLAGPRVSYRRRFTPYAHVMVGGAHRSTTGNFSRTNDGNAFAMTIGIGVDVRVNQRFSIRLLQPEYLRSDFGAAVREDLRLQTGVVFAFGRKP